jgi:lysine biosynthesis protein LysW
MAPCPECDAELRLDPDDIDDIDIGDPWNCPECGSHLRIVNLDPLEFESDDELDDELQGDGDSDDDSEPESDLGDDDAEEEEWDE